MNRGLTSFRALAFFSVLIHHFGVLPFGFLGVNAFFVLSGFLITPILVKMKEQLPVREYFVHFYGRRALRIFPLYYFYVGVVAISLWFFVNREGYMPNQVLDSFLDHLPWTLTYTYNFLAVSDTGKYTFFAGHLWSLAVEEQFYLLWPFVILAVPRKHLPHFLLNCFFLAILFRVGAAMVTVLAVVPSLSSDVFRVVYHLPFSHLDGFAIGGYAALYRRPYIRPFKWWIFVGISILCLILSRFFLPGGVVTGATFAPFVGSNAGVVVEHSLYVLYHLLIVLGYSFVYLLFARWMIRVKEGTFFPALLNKNYMHYLGKISYGLYIYHLGIYWLAVELLSDRLPSLLLVLCVPLIVLPATLVLSSLSYELMEKRFIMLKDRFFPRETR